MGVTAAENVNRSRPPWWVAFALGWAVGCGDAGVSPGNGMSGSTTSQTTTSTSTDSSSTAASSSGGSSSSGADTTSSGSTSSPGLPPGVPPGFLVEPDVHGFQECSLWDQNCPPGEKCVPWANDGGGGWNALRCVPLSPNPDGPGDPCTVEGSGFSGIDSCDAQSTCFNVNENLEGECFAHCVGSEANAQCNQPDHVCLVSGSGLLALCSPTCNPLLEDCGSDEVCVAVDDGFTCAAAAAEPDEGAVGDACEFLNACNSGLVCANAGAVGTCEPGSGQCCTPVCDLTADDCPSPQSCAPWFEPGLAPFGQENVGVCLESA